MFFVLHNFKLCEYFTLVKTYLEPCQHDAWNVFSYESFSIGPCSGLMKNRLNYHLRFSPKDASAGRVCCPSSLGKSLLDI